MLPSPLDSILEAVLTVSPNKQYLGILCPTTPATQEPERSKVRAKRSNKQYLCSLLSEQPGLEV